jgi:predicted nucleotidyltransferase component of viral defense system
MALAKGKQIRNGGLLTMLNNVDDMLDFFQENKAFITAVQYTAARFEFLDVLVEKDFLCSLILKYLYSNNDMALIFKGGTLLSKVHADFNRMSEDLDFMIPMARNVARNQRSESIRPVKELLNNIHLKLRIFTVKQPLIGHNNSCQYTMELNYRSHLTQSYDKILIDIGMRDELFLPADRLKAKTLLMDPFVNDSMVKPFSVIGLNSQEAYAEKTRAALCRRELAIRDYYDLDYAIMNGIIDFENEAFLLLIKKKVQHEVRFHNFSAPEVIRYLQAKVKSELEPTLKRHGIADFNLDRILAQLTLLSKVRPLIGVAS